MGGSACRRPPGTESPHPAQTRLETVEPGAISSPRPLAATDDRNAFDCGRPTMNAWFVRHAWNNHRSGASRVNVITAGSAGRVVGYVTLSSAQIERAFLPKSHQRNQPDPIPVTLLGQLAVDRAWQGQGLVDSLVQFGLRAALKAAESVGSLGVITHPIDDAIRGFYERWDFIDLPFDPRRAMIVRMVDVERTFRSLSDGS
jgi:GNAT superfamily N-acetyltransferase